MGENNGMVEVFDAPGGGSPQRLAHRTSIALRVGSMSGNRKQSQAKPNCGG